ncbi:protein FAM118A isoform X4 [Anas platyrhynchos]|uniref:Family with sequence similarity 118 member A n=1 Tax=Anas platyrhynchos platyrhynchos TaxID=8840 RepID=A0A493TL57_ANAPP|nr:protein FAM118A isoform X5 [Anas platyrhynchos]
MGPGGAAPRPLWRRRGGNGPARNGPARPLSRRSAPGSVFGSASACGAGRGAVVAVAAVAAGAGGWRSRVLSAAGSEMDSLERSTIRSEQKSRKFLKSLITKQPQDLLLVIGTGVSAAVAPGIPALCSWRSCIEAVIEVAEQLEVLHPGDVAEFCKEVIKDRDLLVVAHDLIRKMSPRTGDTKPNFFQDCLMEVFDNLEQHIQNPVVLQSVLRLMERGTMVLTTNYDNLLEIFGHQQGKPMESLDLKDKDKVLQWARGHINYGVLHIHGLYTDPCGMVLDPSGYKDVTQDPEVMEVIQNLYQTKSFLFLGCGETLRDQIFQALSLYTVKNKVDLEHYMLVLKENEDHFFKLQADMLLHGIKVVSYGDCFKQFLEYVQDLTTQICKHRSPGMHNQAPVEKKPEQLNPVQLRTSCMDSAKRKLRENGTDSPKRIEQSDNGISTIE